MANYNHGVKSSYLKSKIGGIITDFKSKFLIAGISSVNCSLLQVFYEGEISDTIVEAETFYKMTIEEKGEQYHCFIDCSVIISRNLEDIVSWLNIYPSSLIAHVDIDELDEILDILKHSSSISYKLRKAM